MREEFFTEDLLQASLHIQVIRGRTLPSQAATSLPTRVCEGNVLPATAPCRAPGRPSSQPGCPFLPRGCRDTAPAAPAKPPGPAQTCRQEGFPSAGAGHGAGRSSSCLPALVNQAEAERGAGGRGRNASPRPAAFAEASRRAAGERGWAPRRRRPGCRRAPGRPAGPRSAGRCLRERRGGPGATPAAARAFVCECQRGAGFSRSNSCHIICTGCKQPSPSPLPSKPPPPLPQS